MSNSIYRKLVLVLAFVFIISSTGVVSAQVGSGNIVQPSGISCNNKDVKVLSCPIKEVPYTVRDVNGCVEKVICVSRYAEGPLLPLPDPAIQTTDTTSQNGGAPTKSGSVTRSGFACAHTVETILSCPVGEKVVTERDANGCYLGSRCEVGGSGSVTGSTGSSASNMTSSPVLFNEMLISNNPGSVSVNNESESSVVGSNSNSDTKKEYIIDGTATYKREMCNKNSDGSGCSISTFKVFDQGSDSDNSRFLITENVTSVDSETGITGGEFSDQTNGIKMTSDLSIKLKANKVVVVENDGEKEVIKPSDAKKAILDYSPKVVNSSIEEVNLQKCNEGECGNSENIYKVEAKKKVRFLGIIPMESSYAYVVNASDKSIISEDGPWYSWLTTK